MKNHLTKKNIQDIYPLTPMQEGIFFHTVYDKSSSVYFEQLSYRVHGNLTIQYVEKSIWELFKRYDILRTVFIQKAADRPLQVVLKERDIDFYYEDVSGRIDKEEYLTGYKVGDREKPFDLSQDILMRVAVLKMGPYEYEFTWSFHHILMDGWCLGIIVSDFFAIYTSYLEGRSWQLPRVKPYRLYIQWLEERGRKASKTYWKSYLEGYEEPVGIPKTSSLNHGDKEKEFKHQEVSFTLNKERVDGLNRLAGINQSTLSTIVRVLWGIMLAKYNSKRDAVFGAVVSGRTAEIADVESIVGLFINTIPVRIRFGENTTYKELVRASQEQAVLGEPHHYYSLAEIQALSIPKQRLLNHIVAFENFPVDRQINKFISDDGKKNGKAILELSNVELFEQTNYDFYVIVNPAEEMVFRLRYNGNVYDNDFVMRMTAHFNGLVEQVLADDEVKVDRLTLITEKEKQRILYQFNETEAIYPLDKTIHGLFAEQVERTPHHVAVIGDSQQSTEVYISYRDLNQRSGELAYILIEKGVQPDTIVGIMVERSIEMMVGLLGIIKAGAAYLPISPGFPRERINYVLTESGVNVLLTTGTVTEKIDSVERWSGDVILLDAGGVFAYPPENLRLPHLPATCLAYVIYTSGSTGRPRGVMIRHRSVINRLNWMQRAYPIGGEDVILQKTTFMFDVSVWELFWWSWYGASLCFLKPGEEGSPGSIIHAIEKYKITTMHFVPPMLEAFLEYLENSGDSHKLWSPGYVFASGEALGVHQVEKFNQLFEKSRVKLINLYGPTEATVDVSYFNCIKGKKYEKIPIGKPIDNIRLYIIDNHRHLQPIGVTGELCIAGHGLARGYLNRPGLTAEKFDQDKKNKSFLGGPGGRFFKKAPLAAGGKLYKTGDLARWLEDGNIEFLGRIDHQVKIRGFRIELGEIENQLLKHEGIKEAVVINKAAENGSQYLCAYIVSAVWGTLGKVPVSKELQEYLSRMLPDYMIPSYFIHIDSIPLTPNGKIDRKALPDPLIEAKEAYIAPRNKREKELAAIWSGVLNIDKDVIGIDSHFFQLGGHSLNAINLSLKIHKAFNVKIELAQIFKTPSIRGLSSLIRESSKETYISIEPLEKKEYYPLSHAQKRMYVLQQMDWENTSYNLPFIEVFSGNIHKGALENVSRAFINRHESLRTSFKMLKGQPVQLIHDEVEFTIDYYEAAKEEAKGIIKNFVKPFALDRSPLLKVGLIVTGENENILVVDMHHIISDGVSMGIILNDFFALYEFETGKKGRNLPLLRIGYKDYAQWQHSENYEKFIKNHEEYWLKEFEEELSPLNLPTDFARPAVKSSQGQSLHFNIEAEKVKSLYKLAQSKDVTLYMLLLAIFNILLSKLSGQEEIIVGTPTAGRRHTDLANIIGMFVNTLALKNKPFAAKVFSYFLSEVKEKTLQAFENQEFPFEDLVNKISLDRDVSRNPVFDVMFAFQKQNQRPGNFFQSKGFERSGTYNYENPTSQFDMTLFVFETDENIHCTLEYCTKLFNRETIERFARCFEKIVSSIILNHQQTIGEIEIVSAEEKRRLLLEFNHTREEYPRDRTIHELFERQVERAPNHLAVIFENKHLTYKEINEKANQLARIIREKGFKPGDIAGIMLERSLEMTICLGAVLKSGGAYLPIDTACPRERLKFILGDSVPRLLLTQERFTGKLEKVPGVINIEDESLYIRDRKNLNKLNGVKDPVYVIYTSGSTGRPKGVILEHQAMVNRLIWMQKQYPLDHNDTILQKTPYTFDVSVWELFWWSITGARVSFLVPGGEKDPAKITDAIQKKNVTVIHFVPSMLNAFLEYVKAAGEISKLIGLKRVFSSGEALTVHQVKDFNEIIHNRTKTKLTNLYGPTEAAIDVSYFDCSTEDHEKIPIGKPISNIQLFIVDKQGFWQPIGVVGELVISGDGLARGYLNRPELTEERFCLRRPGGTLFGKNHPRKAPGLPPQKLLINMAPDRNYGNHVPCNASRQYYSSSLRFYIYKTGDLARWLPDGNIEFFGRIDHQVKVRGFRIEPGEIERQLIKLYYIKKAVVIDKEIKREKYLLAYIVSEKEFETSSLREFLIQELPEYMIPSYFVKLEKFPLTSSGKIDRIALPDPDIGIKPGIEYKVPRNDIEKKLVEIWGKLFGRNVIGINENFFMIGGDSIKAIQVVSRMNEAGYKIGVLDIFKNPSISTLSPKVKKLERIAHQTVVTGVVPLIPIQEEFFKKHTIESHHYNQAVMLYSTKRIHSQAIKAIFEKIQEHHDALRMTFKKNGRMMQYNHGLGYPLSLQEFDFSDQPKENALSLLETESNNIQTSINLETGPLMKLGLFHLPDGDRLLITIHHLVIDGVSWRIMFEDIETLYQQYQQGESLKLPLKTDSFKVWAEKLLEYADSDSFLKEKGYWGQLESLAAGILPINRDFENTEDGDYTKDFTSVSFSLSEEDTRLLLSRVNNAFSTEINDILLTALGLGIKGTFGLNRCLIVLEGHGREEILSDVDIGRTIGWFTSIYPVVLDVSFDNDLSRQVKEIKETLRQVPHRGIGYGILKDLTSAEYKKEVDFRLNPQIIFNYFGQFDTDIKKMSFAIAEESPGNMASLKGQKEYELDISGMIADNRLVLTVSFNKKKYKRETIERLWTLYQSELKRIIKYCSSTIERELTPSDLTYKGLSIENLDEIRKKYLFEDIYRLTPMQEGMLYQALYEKDSPAYLVQFSYRLYGELDISIVERTLNELFRRHSILRTIFIYEKLSHPLQVVLKQQQAAFFYWDLTQFEDKERFIREFKENDRKRLFDLSKDVLMRVTVLQADNNEYEFIWSYHHILVDGWSVGQLISEFFEIYNSCLGNIPYQLPAVKPYCTYIQWLDKQYKEESKKYWAAYLDGYETFTTLPKVTAFKYPEQQYKNERVSFVLGNEKTSGLIQLANRKQVTINTIIRAIWGIILGKYNHKHDVVYGAVVSGRPPEIVNVETMVGLFVNTIPVRIRYDGNTKFFDLLARVQDEAVKGEPYHYCSLAEIQAESLLKQDLLDHIMAFENYPVTRQTVRMNPGDIKEKNELTLELSNIEMHEQSNYDFNLIVYLGKQLEIDILYNSNAISSRLIEKLPVNFEEIINQVVKEPGMEIEKIKISKNYYPLSSAQERVIFMQRRDLASQFYNMQQIIALAKEPVIQQLEITIKKLIEMHESLRTSFEMIADEPVQVIHESHQAAFEIEMVNTSDEAIAGDGIKKLVKPFDLSKAPLFRVILINIEAQKYLLMIDMHHVISDRESLNILLDDFRRLYEGKELPPLGVRYKDFVQWQIRAKESGVIKQQEAYWLKEFPGEVPVLDLPTDYPRLAMRNFVTGMIGFEIDKDDTRALRAYALERGTTIFTVFLAIFNLFLTKLSGQEDILVGILASGRSHRDFEHIVGLFVNTLVLCSSPLGEKTFKAFIEEIKEKTLNHFENQDYPFEDLMEKLNLQLDTSRNPLYDAVFIFQDSETLESHAPGIKLESINDKTDISSVDLTLQCVDRENILACTWAYSTELFKKNTIQRFINYFKKIIDSVIRDFETKISDIEIIPEEEKKLVLLDFNNTAAAYPEEKTLHRMFEEQVERTPYRIAVVGPTDLEYKNHMTYMTYISYRELDKRTDRLAALLIEEGVKTDTLVAIMVERSLEMIIGIFGILKSGGAYLPIDPDYPQERIDYMLTDSGAKILLKDNDFTPEAFNNCPKGIPSHLDLSPTPATSLAYVIYTSGTTGIPKGTMIQHKSVINLVMGLRERVYFCENAINVSWVSPIIFDASIKQIFPSLLLGHKLEIVPEEEWFDGEKLIAFYKERRIQVADGTPTHLNILINYQDQLGLLFPVEQFIVGGEELGKTLCEKFINAVGKKEFKIINVYGPTECCDVTTSFRIVKETISEHPRILIGRPLGNVRVYIFSVVGDLQPIGIPGELFIAGHGVARGYLNRPELTYEKFDHDLWGLWDYQDYYSEEAPKNQKVPAKRNYKSYKTGDLGRWLPDGNIEFLGRLDHQVKLRGYRIELEEIENHLLKHDRVKEVVLVAQQKEENKYLCAYISTNGELDRTELREHLAVNLPDYMIPSYFVFLDKIPLTPSGKVDRKALPAHELKPDDNYIAPRSWKEEKLTDIWAEVLSIKKDAISINCNFLDLGGHSLRAIHMVSQIHKVLNVKVPLKEIFKNPTIKKLSEYINGLTEYKYISVKPVEEREYYFLSPAQERLYVSQQLGGESTAYNMSQVVKLEFIFEKDRLVSTFKRLIQRHSSLRTSFEVIDKQPVQRILQKVDFEFAYYEEFDGGWSRFENIIKDFIRPFDLSSAPLLRVGLIKLGEDSILMVDMHHIICDGVSMQVLIKEFWRLYAGKELQALPLQYKDYAWWQNNQQVKKKIKTHEAYWLNEFVGEIPLLNIPTDFPRPVYLSFEGAHLGFRISKKETLKLRQLAHETETTTFIVLLSICNVFLSKLTGQEDILIGTPEVGRSHEELWRVIGMFANTLVLRNFPGRGKSFKDFLKEVRIRTINAFENRDYQFQDLVDHLKLKRNTGRNPLFDFMFAFQNQGEQTEEGYISIDNESIKSELYQADIHHVPFDLVFIANEIGEELLIEVKYLIQLFKRSTIEKYIGYFKEVMTAVLDNNLIVLKDIKIVQNLHSAQGNIPQMDFAL